MVPVVILVKVTVTPSWVLPGTASSGQLSPAAVPTRPSEYGTCAAPSVSLLSLILTRSFCIPITICKANARSGVHNVYYFLFAFLGLYTGTVSSVASLRPTVAGHRSLRWKGPTLQLCGFTGGCGSVNVFKFSR